MDQLSSIDKCNQRERQTDISIWLSVLTRRNKHFEISQMRRDLLNRFRPSVRNGGNLLFDVIPGRWHRQMNGLICQLKNWNRGDSSHVIRRGYQFPKTIDPTL